MPLIEDLEDEEKGLPEDSLPEGTAKRTLKKDTALLQEFDDSGNPG